MKLTAWWGGLLILIVGVAIVPNGNSAPDGPPASSTDLAPLSDAPQEYPGLHNVLRVSDRIISGSEPYPDKGLRTLKALGVETVVSVDGGKPAVDEARALGLRYVHIPIGYDGLDQPAGLSLARLVREVTGTIYIHCHHGRHRGPSAAAVARIASTTSTPQQALDVLKRAGTSRDYPGLWRDVELYVPPAPGVELPPLVEVAQVESMVAAMAVVDRHFDNLKLLQAADWKLLPDHPDLVPAQEALLVREGFHETVRHLSGTESEEMKGWLKESETIALEIEEALKNKDAKSAHAAFQRMTESCKQCHVKYRN